MDMKMHDETEKDPFDEALADDAASKRDEWMEDEPETTAAAPAVAAVIGEGEPETEAPTKAEPQVSEVEAPAAAESPAPAAAESIAEPAATGVSRSDYDAAVSLFRNDFGEEFANALDTIAKFHAQALTGEASSSLSANLTGQIDQAIGDLQRARHFDAISAAHEDAEEIAESPAFKAWLDSLDEAEKARSQAVTESGTTKEVIALLKKFKAGQAVAAPSEQDEFDLDAATGVKSSPNVPANLAGDDPNDFGDESEWDKDTLGIRR
jgi:hypothetical protein